MKPGHGEVMDIQSERLDLHGCVEVIRALLETVRHSGSDYFNSTPVVTLSDRYELDGGTAICWSCPLDLKAVCVVGALTQAPVMFRGSTDRGKTALGERVLTGLFGAHGDGWVRMEMNRGMTVDDLIDIDIEKLSKAKLSEAVSAAKWLGMPARLLDEINRVHAKLANLALHLVDGSGFNLRGDLTVPVGIPYRVNEREKRYSFTIATANQLHNDYAGVFEEDAALTRRVVISLDLDEVPPGTRDLAHLLAERRAKAAPQPDRAHTRDVIEVYEALPRVVDFSAKALLLLHYLAGMNHCVRARSGQLQPGLVPEICGSCHLSKAHPYCGRVGGLSEGLLLWTKELSTVLAAVRAGLVLEQVSETCCGESSDDHKAHRLQSLLDTQCTGQKLYELFHDRYLRDLSVSVRDVQAAYALVAPSHVWMQTAWLEGQQGDERKPHYVCRRVAEDAWMNLKRFLTEHEDLVSRLAQNQPLSDQEQAQVETIVTTRDAAMLSVIAALRDQSVPLQCREDMFKATPALSA